MTLPQIIVIAVAAGGATVPELMGVSLMQGGAAAVVLLIVVLILRGALVPRSVVKDLLAGRDARIQDVTAQRDTWRAAHQESEEARHVAQGQVGELLELSRTADHLLRSLPTKKRDHQGVNARAPLAQLDHLVAPPE